MKQEEVSDDMLISLLGHSLPIPVVKEWFVFPGNTLKEPKMVSPKLFNDSGTRNVSKPCINTCYLP